MEKTLKNLKIYSVLVLIVAGLMLVQTVIALIFSVNISVLPDGATENEVLIARIILGVITVLLLIPQVYVGIRGLQLAKKPAPAKAPFVWAVILITVFSLSLIAPVVAIIEQNDVGSNISAVLSILVDLFIYADFIKYMNEMKKGLK